MSHISKLPSTLLPDEGLGNTEGWSPKVSGNGAASFEMFSYLIMCPSNLSGLASCVWLGPTFLFPAPLPVGASHDSRCCLPPYFHIDQFQFIS